MIKQDAPFTIQIDLTLGCNIRVPRPDGTVGLCWACGLNAIREGTGDYKFMTMETAERLAQQIKKSGWTSQLLFAGHGEPSMNPQMFDIIAVFRKHLPKQYMVMLSNGAGFVKEGNVKKIFDAGLTTLALEDYEGGLMAKVKLPEGMAPLYYPSNKEGNPHQRSKKQRLVVMDDLVTTTQGTHNKASLNNHTGCGLPPRTVQARCAKPFREVSVKWDGCVSLCCVDWRRVTEFGNVNDTPLEDIWQNELFAASRRILIKGDRKKIKLCSGCDHPSHRVGLLPDKFGKVKLGDYTQADVDLVANNRATVAIPIVLRPWEK